MNIVNLLFVPNGRIAAGPFWIGVAILIAVNLVSQFIPILGFVLSLLMVYVGVCVYGKRLHDAGKSAWLHVIPWIVSLIVMFVSIGMVTGEIIAATEAGEEPDLTVLFAANPAAAGVFAFSLLIWLGWTVWVGTLKSDPAANRHGPPVSAAPAEAPPAA
ncbi:DUF805 domain-containing protein [Glycocaulis profundi]|nr:DUF805 domain-containing protein [Glycocaulis profundi]